MEITKKQLKQIIEEELADILSKKVRIFGDQNKYIKPAYSNPEVNVIEFTSEGEKFFFNGEEVYTAESDEEVTNEFTQEELDVLVAQFKKTKEEGNFN